MDKASSEATYTETVDATAVRMVLRLGALRDMSICGTDVSTAFLNADLSDSDMAKGILCRAPAIFAEAGATQRGEVWIIRKGIVWSAAKPKSVGYPSRSLP